MTKNTSQIPVVLITGTSNGIGKYLVEYYVKQGLYVIGCSRSDIDYEFDNYFHFQLDISNESYVKNMFSEIRKKYNRLDILINNAGIASHNHTLLTSINEVKKIFNTNFVGTFLCSREAVKLMKNNKYGRIVNISSVHVPFGMPGTSLYGASKASVEQFSRVFAKEVYQFGITINLLSLSVVKNSGMADNLSEDRTNELLNKTISKTQIEYENISHAIDFLVSEKSKMITNQNLFLGGV